MKRPRPGEDYLTKTHARFFQMDVDCPKRQILLLPGWNFATGQGALCLESALTQKMIDRRTQILCVEHAPPHVPPISAKIAQMGLTSRTRIHAGPLHGLGLKPVEQFDYAFFDLHLCLDRATALWIASTFTENICEGADIALSVRHTDAASPFLRECRKAFSTTYRREAAATKARYGIEDRTTLIHALIVMTLFRDFEFDYHPERIFWPGPDAMIAFKLTDLRRRSGATMWPTIQEVAEVGQTRINRVSS